MAERGPGVGSDSSRIKPARRLPRQLRQMEQIAQNNVMVTDGLFDFTRAAQ